MATVGSVRTHPTLVHLRNSSSHHPKKQIKMQVLIALLGLAAVASAGTLNAPACNAGEVGRLISVTCDQFEDGAEVIIKRGNKYDFTITFEAGQDAALLTPSIFGVIAGINVPWLGVPANACNSLISGSCPLVAGQTYVYSASVDVLSSYPAVPLTFRWSLVSADASGTKGDSQICFTMPARITA